MLTHFRTVAQLVVVVDVLPLLLLFVVVFRIGVHIVGVLPLVLLVLPVCRGPGWKPLPVLLLPPPLPPTVRRGRLLEVVVVVAAAVVLEALWVTLIVEDLVVSEGLLVLGMVVGVVGVLLRIVPDGCCACR